MTNNPLLQEVALPKFDKIHPKHFKPAILAAIEKDSATTKKLLSQKNFTWDNFIEPLDNANNKLIFVWSAISHLNNVMGSKNIREAYEKCIPLATKYFSEISQNTKIYNAIKTIANSNEYRKLNAIQKKIIQDKLRDFVLSGVALSTKEKLHFTSLNQKLAKLGNTFSHNVVDASQSWFIELNKKQTEGLPQSALALGKAYAQKKKWKGWVFTLDFPSYYPLITFLKSRSIRKKIYIAYVTRATGERSKKLDNTKNIEEILKIRCEIANILSFKNFAEYSLATKMAKSTKQVTGFLNDLAKKSLTTGKKEIKEITKLANKDGIKKIEPWDIAYYEEKLSEKKFELSQEELRPYFPEPQVLNGIFSIVKKLFGITIKEKTNIPVWHKDVRFFEAHDSKKNLRGQFYFDLYCRENKRGGAWMDNCESRHVLKNKKIRTPVAHVVCNFSPPEKNKPALFTHNEVITLLHELGHCLQHILTKIDYVAVAGINNVPWDAVELSSQLMENWGWQKEGIKLLSKHYKTKANLPDKILQRLVKQRNFNSATHMLRQLEFSLIDFNIHLNSKPSKISQLRKTISKIQKQVRVTPIYKKAQFLHAFSHIFGGGYAAGYYSYKWAELLSADAFSKFESKGIFDKRTGREFLHCILETGGSEDPMVLFKKFRGRAPKIDALLKHSGISNKK